MPPPPLPKKNQACPLGADKRDQWGCNKVVKKKHVSFLEQREVHTTVCNATAQFHSHVCLFTKKDMYFSPHITTAHENTAVFFKTRSVF